MTDFSDTTPFTAPFSTIDNPRLEMVMEVRLNFPEAYSMVPLPGGGMRTAVLVQEGTFEGPLLKGKAIPGSGGDYAYWRGDEVACLDARYLLQEDDGTTIMLMNKGFLWGRQPDTMQRIRDWAFNSGAPVDHGEYYLRSQTTFECAAGKHDWLTKHVFIGVGERRTEGNRLRYYALT
ncbi:MAG: DUF3237 domain-containing protein [Alteraurantiacibacter sp.]